MVNKNLVLITMDEVRADHISCYGYKRIETKNIDKIALDGVRFSTCIASSVLTPVSHASLLSGQYPFTHGLRGPFDKFCSRTLPTILKKYGYETAGFVGNSMLGADLGFDNGFDTFDEPKIGDEFMWELHSYNDPNHPNIRFPWGNWWIDRMIRWIEGNIEKSFFVFGHFFHTHEGSERQLIELDLIDGASSRSDYGYYDEKIRLCDEEFIGPIIEVLKRNGIYTDTTIIITADHGTTLGERPLPPIPWRENVTYPQHTTMYEPDIRVPLIIKDKDFPRDITVDKCVKHVDIFPTLLRLMDIELSEKSEGMDLNSIVEGKDVNGFKAYIEDLFPLRGLGALQAIRTEKHKYILNQTTSEEEFYDLKEDPKEERNRIHDLSRREGMLLDSWRKELDRYYRSHVHSPSSRANNTIRSESNMNVPTRDKEVIMERLRTLGYI